MAGDIGFWVQVAQYGVSAILVVAGVRGMYVYRWHYDDTVGRLETQLVEQRERAERAEAREVVLQGMLFEALGVNKAVITKLEAA